MVDDMSSLHVQPVHLRDGNIVEGTFSTDDQVTRAFMVAGIDPSTDFFGIGREFNVCSPT